ncbi:MAG: di-heme-cytochrome C peroxidase [Pseudomonadota bacterium]
MTSPILICITILCLVAAAAVGAEEKSHDAIIQDGTPVPGGSTKLVNLNQGWSQATQSGYWYGGDGSLIIPYDWFLILEQAQSTELFRSDANIERLRYIPVPKSQWNPDGMPAGFAKNIDPTNNEAFMALSCGGCHTTKISYKDTSMIINGAATMGDFQQMMLDLESAMVATLKQTDKFTRFAKTLLGKNYNAETSAQLRADLQEKTDIQINFNYNNRTPSKFGFGRVDAFAYAYNNIGVTFLGIPENHVDGIAPANYNFIWGTAQSDVLQWNGSAPNTPPIAPIFRVLGDVWGGGGRAHLHAKIWPIGYESTANFKGLGDMLSWVKVLQSPQWPETILPKIDRDQAIRGRQLYESQCVSCHQLTLTRAEQMQPYSAVMVPQTKVGTDRAELVLIEEPVQKTGILEGTKMFYIAGEKLGPTTPAKNLLNITSIGVMFRHPEETIQQGLRDFTGTKGRSVDDLYSYKARPLTGIWATSPYLHNGSVPNLYQLLLPSVKRDKIFFTGNRNFDPKNVGQLSAKQAGLFKFDTSLYGNSNSGHEYGVTLNDQQRFDLIEFMKTL